MIRVLKKDNYIKISGHANYDEVGKDIVCASVSSIVYTTVNGILNIDSKSIKFEDNESMEITILNDSSVILKLINNMMELLSDLSNKYPKKIKISEGE